jgi:hypothetical protein
MISRKEESILTRSREVRERFAKYDTVERVLESYDMKILRTESLPEGEDAHVLGNTIFVRSKLARIYETLCALHELGHSLVHAKCIGYRVSDELLVRKQEREAETFATLVLHPSLQDYKDEQDFIALSGLPAASAKLRINFFRRTGI